MNDHLGPSPSASHDAADTPPKNDSRVLVVDDNGMSRRKMAAAVNRLGAESTEAVSGREALDLLRDTDFDLVLLDIVMPEMDGFDVLREMQADSRLSATPVLVISGIDGDVDSVARAIKLGAADFLPKDFNPTLFKARVEASIEKKRLRDTEQDHLRQMAKLSEAARLMETNKFHPQNLGLETVAARTDSVGQLASVFVEMATQVYDREVALMGKIRTLKGGALLIAVGVLWGLVVPLSVMIYKDNQMTLGVTFWSQLIASAACLAWALAERKRIRVSAADVRFLLGWAALTDLSTIVLFEAAGRVTGITLSIMVAMEGLAVFALAAALKIEAPSLRRFAGLGLGLLGVLALLMLRGETAGLNSPAWILIAMLVPIMYGMSDVYIAARQPAGLDPVVASAVGLLIAAVLALPFALVRGQFFVLFAGYGTADVLVALVGISSGLCTVLFIRLIATAGAVFGSQNSYAITAAGIAWSVFLLGETPSLWSGLALVMIVLGLILVGAKREAADVEVEFRRKRKPGLVKQPAE